MRLESGATTLLALAWLSNIGLSESQSHGSKPAPEVCESRTINYITHTLPQQCLRTSWTSAPATAATTTGDDASVTATPTDSVAPGDEKTADQPTDKKAEPRERQADVPKEHARDQQAPADKAAEEEQDDLATSSFMSFEEWKEMMLRKSGQDPAQVKQHEKPPKEHKGHREAGDSQADLDSLGDDGEISLDFDALSDKVSELTAAQSGGPTPKSSAQTREEQVLLDDGKMQYYRSKDAGKTCKERFSYSSFDAGATVLKTSPGAKNAKSILVENKDSYMLLECHAKNKFVIVELSDDILVDTVVLANFEFFSSMIRRFRVSVSDRYPVKLDKWVELGTYEARNSRDIQAFLIEHPQIYTKYIRIEFLTHYGNEYYCPVSLLRVHGTRMLDSWKEPDNGRDDDEPEATIEAAPEERVPDNPQQASEPDQETTQPSNTTEHISVPDVDVVTPVKEVNISQWPPIFGYEVSLDTCSAEPSTTDSPTPVSAQPVSEEADSSMQATASRAASDTPPSTPSGATIVSASTEASPKTSSSSSSTSSTSVPPPVPSTGSAASSKATGARSGSNQQESSLKANVTEPVTSPPTIKMSSSSTYSTKNRTATSAASSASPTVQEGFFKAVTKRLQHLETNTSLSLQYIEEQSRFLQEALQKMEKRQVSRVDAFLDSLNKTVFAELRNVRAQYDQIWQSTVIALESQREQSQRETVALSERLSLLADEVVFQKRMAILQSVLLLAALVLVIFSRGYYVNAPGAEYYPMSSPFRHHNHNASISAPALVDSPRRSPQSDDLDQDSPEFSGASPSPGRTGSLRQPLSRSDSYQDKDLPLTPVSKSAASSIHSREPTPAINVEAVDVPFHNVGAGGNFITPPRNRRDDSLLSDDSEVPSSVEGTPVRSSGDPARSANDEYMSGSDILDCIQEQHEQQQAQNPRWSAMSQLGGARKPLPALPEDVPEDRTSG
ncbi:Sad1 unc domain protein [Coniochaeta hoffmannii]|uniref:Sad1 unc domain protein n=1 Tax=Coniochaeta hoffmannii TaxID=91930 RepID=A0AA38VNG3_9PEZI|nr:Sad1 unc domain protein [Coniochaeta hoffmannii]